MVEEGEQAPGFGLPGVTDRAASTFDLEQTTSGGTAVVLMFYPFDFSPVCTSELCSLRDSAFFGLTDGVETVRALPGVDAGAVEPGREPERDQSLVEDPLRPDREEEDE
jgi:hypothetical protein